MAHTSHNIRFVQNRWRRKSMSEVNIVSDLPLRYEICTYEFNIDICNYVNLKIIDIIYI